MNYVGIVLISHSPEIVKGLESLLKQIQENVPLAIAGGTDENEIGTDVFKIKQAIESVYSEKGVVILFDLGSALLNAEMAIEMLEDYPNIKIADAPIVEGAYAAVIEAGIGGTLEEVAAAAEGAKNLQKVH
ncbi:dihydroxyacetone kinase, phosphotransfer subunit [Bacillus methanolicus PB1]|uniref:phosphoenolpyruvate--glycerone phosphotransferase n=1 Tax=Bacillus methanolicus PB1 TaxID=997296 RepID=I3E5I0_BACMT|nr:dihydroxyacetone kinase phosphoryl donor subunit DhaM [Bacillus methanolicus]EIJ81751.1 dihydroxyacetone kinase, phosphotransfer subunit [Bacillus methanolicus PB1]